MRVVSFLLSLAVSDAAHAADVCKATGGVCSGAGEPHGGSLVSTYVADEAARKLLIKEATATYELSERQACDVALLVNGGFSPLQGFMKQADYDGVVNDMRTEEHGVLFGLPVVLDVNDASLQGKKSYPTVQGH